MAREHLKKRENWQQEANISGTDAEVAFETALGQHFSGTDLQICRKPKDLSKIYGKYGIEPDFSIYCKKTKKSIYVEITRQGNSGNAHERSCRYMMPGILHSAREFANQPGEVIPIWWIFSNGIASNLRYRLQILHWFRGIEGHVLLWENIEDSAALVNHFDHHIRNLL